MCSTSSSSKIRKILTCTFTTPIRLNNHYRSNLHPKKKFDEKETKNVDFYRSLNVLIHFFSIDNSWKEFFNGWMTFNTKFFFQLCDSISISRKRTFSMFVDIRILPITIDESERNGVLMHQSFEITKNSIDITPKWKMKLKILSKQFGMCL